jgi:hypothetical protein
MIQDTGFFVGGFSFARLLQDEAFVARAMAQAETAEEELDLETLKFWSDEVREPAELYSRGVTTRAARTEEPVFVYYDDTQGFQVASSTDSEDLPDSGHLDTLLRVERFRPSAADRKDYSKIKMGSLRIDLQQTEPMPGLVEVLAWSAVAALLPDSEGKLPALKQLSFDPGTAWGKLQRVPLEGGLGFWTWNFFLQKDPGIWGEIIEYFKMANKAVFPLLGLPAIALTALKAVDRVLGYIQSKKKSEWLLKSTAVPVFGTRKAADKVGGSGIALRTGRYLILPADHVGDFGKQRDKLKLTNQGLLVPKEADDFEAYEAADNVLPALRYISVYVQATLRQA